ncbi:MAG: succinate dehydrogenase, hydrophobic membrane anchor protein [Candidatus Pelagibacter sp.]|nr:succinate dehydrogenase, hydrophobic membrane anchor protein [Candidatus Pelagibacter sp.]|tara:strand:- start:595 stop:924 length:330 start_codon:yes stop_codon:yes gene_type:complete
MFSPTKKWLFIKASSVILIPLMIWFTFIFAGIYDKNIDEITYFLISQPTKFLLSMLFVVAYFFSALTISEIFEDYVESEKIKNVANKLLYLFAIIIPIITIIFIYNLSL